MKLIDLSVNWEVNPYAEPFLPSFSMSDHVTEATKLGEKMGVPAHAYQDSMALAIETVQTNFHSGTHVDAPLHFGPLCEGKPAKSVDQLPLEDFMGNGVILDMRHKAPATKITLEDVRQALADMDYTIVPGDIVLIMTGMDKFIYDERYLRDQPGMSAEATEWLIDQGVKLMGIDAYTFDLPFGTMSRLYKEGDANALFPAHFVGRRKEYYHMEKLANLDAVPVKHGFTFVGFPVKVKGGTAGFIRAVALVNET